MDGTVNAPGPAQEVLAPWFSKLIAVQAKGRTGEPRGAQKKPLIERAARPLRHPERLAHDLHVLLRHRPRSISPVDLWTASAYVSGTDELGRAGRS